MLARPGRQPSHCESLIHPNLGSSVFINVERTLETPTQQLYLAYG